MQNVKNSKILVAKLLSNDWMLASQIKVGTYVKKTNDAKKVWIAKGYCRINRAYQFDDANDISNCFYVKNKSGHGKILFVGFEY